MMAPAAAAHETITPAWLADVIAEAAVAETVEQIAARLTPLFADTGWLAQLTEHWIAPLHTDPAVRPSLPTTRSGSIVTMTLALSPPVRLLLTLMEGAPERAEDHASPAPTIGFSGAHGLYRLLSPKAVSATLAYARLGATRCRNRRISLRPDRTVSLDERRIALLIASHAQPILLLRARIDRSPSLPLRRYTLDTGALLGTVQGDQSFARSAMLLSVLRAANAREAIPLMIDMLGRENADERWTAMRELLALDAQAGFPHLEVMASHDTAPSVRVAARAAVDRLKTLTLPSEAPCPA